MKLIQEGHLSRDLLRNSGLVSILIDYLIPPNDYLCAQALKTDNEELKLSLLLKGTSQFNLDTSTGKEEALKDVLYGISLKMLRLTIMVLTNNLDNQILFRERQVYTLHN
jgi:hypothetical protein